MARCPLPEKSYAMTRIRRAPTLVIAPDSFKGSLDAPAVSAAIARGMARVWPNADIRICPMADGGEGTLDAVLSSGTGPGQQAGTARRSCTVTGAGGARKGAAYGLLSALDGPTAVIETAQIVGITDAAGMAVDVAHRSTRGVGELVRALLDDGVRRFMIGLGGSSTNDGGAGMLAALGLRLRDTAGGDVAPTPQGLAALARVDADGLDPRLGECTITILSDVDNPLCGPHGATATFGPQKGVREDAIAAFDATLARYARITEAAVGREAATNLGAGAAGGLGFALQLIGATPRAGAEVVADLVGLDAALQGADWLITGEGRSDVQTLGGKAPFVVARRARAAGVAPTLLSGAVDPAALPDLGRVFAGCFALPAGPMTLAECIERAETLLADRAEQIARLWAAARGE
jgi:glycerate kinase